MKQSNEGGVENAMKINRADDHHETEQLWQVSEQLPFIKSLKSGKTVAQAMEQLDLETAFKEQPSELGCCDGRICHHRF